MDFKTFLINEEIALGNIGAKMGKLFSNPHYQQRAGAYLSSDVNGTQTMPALPLDVSPSAPATDLKIPQVERTGRIVTLLLKRNPIFVKLSDGTEANFTYDEWKRIEGEPEVGKVMTIIFQRHPRDTGKSHSKIEKVIVR